MKDTPAADKRGCGGLATAGRLGMEARLLCLHWISMHIERLCFAFMVLFYSDG